MSDPEWLVGYNNAREYYIHQIAQLEAELAETQRYAEAREQDLVDMAHELFHLEAKLAYTEKRMNAWRQLARMWRLFGSRHVMYDGLTTGWVYRFLKSGQTPPPF